MDFIFTLFSLGLAIFCPPALLIAFCVGILAMIGNLRRDPKREYLEAQISDKRKATELKDAQIKRVQSMDANTRENAGMAEARKSWYEEQIRKKELENEILRRQLGLPYTPPENLP